MSIDEKSNKKISEFKIIPHYLTMRKLAIVKPKIIITRDLLKLYFNSYSKEDIVSLLKFYQNKKVLEPISSICGFKFQFTIFFLEHVELEDKNN